MTSKDRQKITAKDVGKLAEVAGLKVDAGRLETLTARYWGFLDEIEKLKELDISNQEPATVFKAGDALP